MQAAVAMKTANTGRCARARLKYRFPAAQGELKPNSHLAPQRNVKRYVPVLVEKRCVANDDATHRNATRDAFSVKQVVSKIFASSKSKKYTTRQSEKIGKATSVRKVQVQE